MIDWHDKKTITSGEAVLAVNQLIDKYEAVISRVLKIKQEMPESNGFRRHRQNTALLEDLQKILTELREKAAQIEKQLLEKNV